MSASSPVGAISDFGFSISPGLQYRVIVERDLHRGDRSGYKARLISVGIGTVMEPGGSSPSAALTQLARELHAGDAVDKKIAKEIVRHAWFPLKLA